MLGIVKDEQCVILKKVKIYNHSTQHLLIDFLLLIKKGILEGRKNVIDFRISGKYDERIYIITDREKLT